MELIDAEVKALFVRYQRLFEKGLSGVIDLSAIDDRHRVAHVGWAANYARRGQPDVAIAFEVHYLIQKLDGEPKIFGWVSGDEQELLRQHGIGPDSTDHPG